MKKKVCNIVIEESVKNKDFSSVIEAAKSVANKCGKHIIDGITYTVNSNKIIATI